VPLYWHTPIHPLHFHSSQTSLGAVLPQRVQNAWQPITFFSKKLNSAQQKYNAHDRELLAIYKAIKHFHHMLEARYFIIFADNKPTPSSRNEIYAH
jgi:hypothetical protein